ncbi:hypothetical protein ACIQ9R_24855 [Streptomyces sp. NPDC094447]|uniref:hypothetical protein n=1 Tax=Streptomyces sp. NPDC094447 TaxID=3366062 RepID=UPI003809CF40
MYAPMMRREVYLLCFGPGHEVLAVRRGPEGRASLPSTQRRERETYGQAARRLMAIGAIRPGDVVARVEPLPSSLPFGRREARIFTAHSDRLFLVESGGWEPWEELLPGLNHLELPELALFVEGYIGGWIPDGWITLEP